MKYLFVFLSLIASCTYACSLPKKGFGYSFEELIDNSETIVIVELVDTAQNTLGYNHTLTPVETIKGSAKNKYEFLSAFNEYESKTFSDHNSAEFWSTDTGRSTWPCCICGPDHTFIRGV